MRFVALFAVGVLVAGGARTQEKFIDHMNAMTAVLAQVKDKELGAALACARHKRETCVAR